MSDPIDFLTGRPMALASVYGALAPNPDSEYGAILPFAANRVGSPAWVTEGSNFRFAMPEFLRSALKGIVDLGASTETGSLTPEALETITLGSLGAGGALAPRAGLAAGGAGRPTGNLPMDLASRDRRAKEMGFLCRPGTDDFLTVYHGTNKEISPGFLLNPPARATNAASAEAGIWTTEAPSVAHMYAEHAARAGASGPSVLPLRARADKIGTLHPEPGMTEKEVLGALRDAWDAGYDAIRVTNHSTRTDGPAPVSWVFKDPSQLRSPFAAFDPAKRSSPDLMAGFAVPGPSPVPGPGASRSPEPAPSRLIRLRTGQVIDETVIPNHLRSPGRQVY